MLLWSINGFAQSLMWPPLVKIMATNLNSADYERACVRVSWGSSILLWAAVALAGMLLCLGLMKKWQHFQRNTP